MSSHISSHKQPVGLFLFFIACLGHFIVDFSIGLWPVWKTIAHYDLATSGLIAGISVMIGEAMQSLFSVYADRGHWRPLIGYGCLIASMSLALPFASSVHGAGVLFFFTCLGSSAFHPTAVGIVASYKKTNRTILIAIFHTSGLLGLAISQALFTYLLEKHYALPLSFMFLPILLGIILFIMRMQKHEGIRSEEEAQKVTLQREKVSMMVFLDFLQRSELRKLYFLLLCNQIMAWSFLFLLPDFLLEKGASQSFAYGGGHFTNIFGAACACVPLGILANRLNTPLIVLITYILSIIGLGSIMFVSAAHPTLLTIFLFIIGGSIGAIPPLALSIGNDLEPHRSATISAFLMGFVWIFSEGIGYSLSAYIATCFSSNQATNAILVMGSTLLIGVVQAYRLYKQLIKKNQDHSPIS